MNAKTLTRRTFLARGCAAATAATVAGCASTASTKARTEASHKPDQPPPPTAQTWTNWSGSVTTKPKTIEQPTSEKAVVELVHRANTENLTVRVAGSGHSFVPLCAVDDGMLLTLNGLRGIVSTDTEALEATVYGGTKLFQLGKPLRQAGMAMESISDVDVQAVAGAIATGNHGTGHGIRSMSNQVVGIRLVTATGDILECSAEQQPEIFKAAQVSVGALGIVTQVRFRLQPTYRLHEKTWRASFDECFESMGRLISENRHFEFFWVSSLDACLLKTLNPTDEAPSDLPDRPGERIGHSDEIFPSVRSMKFNEIEFSLPEENGPDCLLEVRTLLMDKYPEVSMPLEYRTLAADDVYLSPAYGRNTVTLSAHRIAAAPHQTFFADVEAIFRNHRGRPHWGKVHTQTLAELSNSYPKWNAFHEVREQLDPNGRFLNPYLRKLFVG